MLSRFSQRRHRQLFWGIAGTGGFVVFQWLTIAALSQRSSPAVVGEFALGLAVTTPIVLATNLQLRNLIVTDHDHQFSYSDYVGLRLLTVPIDLLLIGIAALAVGWNSRQVATIIAVALTKEIDSVSDIAYGYFLRYRRVDRMAKSLLLRGVTFFLLVAFATIRGGSLLTGLGLASLGWLAIYFFHDLRVVRVLVREPSSSDSDPVGKVYRPRFSRSTSRKLVGLGFPLGLSSLIIALSASFPRLVLERSIGVSELGIYAALAYLTMAGSTVVNSVCQTVLPALSLAYVKQRDAVFKRYLMFMTSGAALAGALMVAGSFLAGGPVLGIVYGSKYTPFVGTLRWIAVASLFTFLASTMTWALTAMRRLRSQVVILTISCVVVVLVSFALIPQHGMKATAWATMAGMITQATLGLADIAFELCRRKPTS